jgi:predicted MFS family arabinose efflux permease
MVCHDHPVTGSWGVVNRVARDRQLRRLELGFAGFAIAEHGTWLASIMFAYDRGGVDEAGFAAFGLLAPALLVAPIAAFAADRFPSGRVLAVGYALQGVAMLTTALAIATGAPAAFVYVAAAFAASAVTLTRPAMGSLLPTVTRTPSDLTAANVIIGFVEYTGMFVGPALTGVLVATTGLAAPFAVCGALTIGSAVLALGVRTEAGYVRRDAGERRGGALADTRDGLRALRGHRPVRTMMIMLSLGSLVIGATDVLFVATADQLSGGDTSKAGLFGTAFGIGAMVGSVVSVVLIGRARITPFIATSIAAMGVALAALSTTGAVAAAVVLYMLIGGGESVLRVAASTLIQRVAPSEVIGRFFGVAEGLHSFSVAVGAGLIGVLVQRAGYESALIIAGCTVPALLLLRISRLFQIDRNARAPDRRVLELILGDDMFDGLPAPVIERLANDAQPRRFSAQTAVTVEGEVGEHYFVIDRGQAEVTIGGEHVRPLGPGNGFGELALLRDSPRTATVTATTDLELLAFQREQFLQAVGGHQRSTTVGRERADRYLGAAD